MAVKFWSGGLSLKVFLPLLPQKSFLLIALRFAARRLRRKEGAFSFGTQHLRNQRVRGKRAHTDSTRRFARGQAVLMGYFLFALPGWCLAGPSVTAPIFIRLAGSASNRPSAKMLA
jgi:uncharacterized membrane protein YbaN (DUF454 family)